jgi:hypothetical protein
MTLDIAGSSTRWWSQNIAAYECMARKREGCLYLLCEFLNRIATLPINPWLRHQFALDLCHRLHWLVVYR